MNIYDISERAGVSIATVSRVLNNSSRVSEKTRQKVLSVMEECGYTPNAFARGLGLNSMKTIGVMCSDSSYPYQAKAVYFIQQQLRSYGYDCILCCTGDEYLHKKEYCDLLLTKKVDGIILVGSGYISQKPEENRFITETAQKVPVMLLNGHVEGDNVYCIVTDDERSMEKAATYLLEEGEGQELLYLYNALSDSGRRKIQGIKKACEKKGMDPEAARIYYFDGYHEDIPRIADFLHQLSEKGITFNKILCSDDSLAMGALRYAYQEKLQVPEKLQIMGYGNSMLVHCCNPQLTSVDTKEEIMCRTLVDTLLHVLDGEEKPAIQVYSGELMLRGTTLSRK